MIQVPRQSGLTLIEILISLLIGAFILTGVLQIFATSRKTYAMQEALTRLQENGRFAMDFVSRDLRMAGFLGCNRNAQLLSTLSEPLPGAMTNANYLFRYNVPIEGFDSTGGGWVPLVPPAIVAPLPSSDILTVRRAGNQGFPVTNHPAGINPLTIGATAAQLVDGDVDDCDFVVVSNCLTAAVFQIDNRAGSVLNHDGTGACPAPTNVSFDLVNSYTGGQVFSISTTSYYVSLNPSNIPALFRRINGNPAQELVEGIEQMQIVYGVDFNDDNNIDYYTRAGVTELDTPEEWGRVVSVRISMLVRTIEDLIAETPQSYIFPLTNDVGSENNVVTIAPDRRIRRVFTSTIAVRNRI